MFPDIRIGRISKTPVLESEDYYVWDCSVIKVGESYHLFASRWKKELGFGFNWLLNSEIIRCESRELFGPYTYKQTVLKRRGPGYFDGMNTHNPCIKYYNGKFYLYYMGTTYGDIGDTNDKKFNHGLFTEIWNRKRIGLAVADTVDGEYRRFDAPVLSPRTCDFWDCTGVTNPSVAILDNGKTYMIYKSRSYADGPLKLSVAVADSPDGTFERLTDEPIFGFRDDNIHVEDPFLWYDEQKRKFCIIAKDDCKNGSRGITGEWGNVFYAESDDCIDFRIPENPLVFTRKQTFTDGKAVKFCNLERPFIYFDESNRPKAIFCSSGYGKKPYDFKKGTFIVGLPIVDNR